MATQPEASGPADGARVSAAAEANGRRSMIDLTRTAVEDVVRLVQQEIQLAKLELKEMVVSNARGGAMLATAGACVVMFLILGLVTIALVIPAHALAAAIEAAVFLVAAIVLVLLGKRQLKFGPPPRTMRSLREDAEWARQLLKRNGK